MPRPNVLRRLIPLAAFAVLSAGAPFTPRAAGQGLEGVEDLKAEADRAFEGKIGIGPMRAALRSGKPLQPPRLLPVRHGPWELADIHAHLFMEHGLGVLFQGGFNEPLQAGDWSDRFSSQANPASLDASNLGLVVVALYAHPVLEPSRRSAIRDQIYEARAFVASHTDWVIAASPAEARAAHAAGKRILVLSLEGASGILETEEDLREFVDAGGIRIVTFAHLADDHLTGAAMMGGFKNLGNPRGWVAALPKPRGQYGELLNPHGLTDRGRAMAWALMRRGVWIDLAHSPDSAAVELEALMKRAGQPLLVTHTVLRRYRRAERGLSDRQLSEVGASGGLVGLAPCEDVLDDTKVPPALCPKGCRCRGDVYALAQQFRETADAIGAASVFLGSDFNGAETHLRPSGCSTHTSLDKQGLHQIGQTSEVWYALRRAGAPVNATEFHGVTNFISVWERAYAARGN